MSPRTQGQSVAARTCQLGPILILIRVGGAPSLPPKPCALDIILCFYKAVMVQIIPIKSSPSFAYCYHLTQPRYNNQSQEINAGTMIYSFVNDETKLERSNRLPEGTQHRAAESQSPLRTQVPSYQVSSEIPLCEERSWRTGRVEGSIASSCRHHGHKTFSGIRVTPSLLLI